MTGPRTTPTGSPWDGNECAMVFDGDTGNAIDYFPYTADELEARALDLRRLAGELTMVTMEPSDYGRLSS